MGEVKEVSVGDIGSRAAEADPELKAETMASVSYTHLTLPTNA